VSTSLELLEDEILKLTPSDRAHLLSRLVASLDKDPQIEAEWDRVAERREAELDSGAVHAVAADEAIARLRARLQR